ncbi:unnamed protein product [Thlaspi arvense]|uniref:J domain-containing protein n=1 Tax=Thlaspi arvense TaxID=13288 RepID=A0AAU9SNW2_THLAR|nr:unnamed protein product [Thlaspi arvense]
MLDNIFCNGEAPSRVMECNKDEAKRAMDIAERKVTEKDYNGAKKFAIKAQNLYPHLDGLNQLLMTVDVYISGEKQISGEADWYGILGVDPLADDEVVRKQYRKLALMLHPDKNKCKGAEGAFKLLSEAWSLLSDKSRRFSYNLKRQVKEKFTTTQSGNPLRRPPSSNGYQNVKEPVVSRPRARTKPAAPPVRMDRPRMDPPVVVAPVRKESSTFWTMCNACKTQYEYLRVYLNQILLCPNCREGFVAAEKAPPPSVPPKPVNLSFNQQHRSSKTQATNKNSYGTSSGREPATSGSHGFRWESLSRMHGSNNRNATNQAAAANVVQQAQDRVKRGFGESQERDVARGFTNSDLKNFKKPKTDDSRMSDFHNFDLDRSETSFQDDQIWAAYDDDDGMPRFYARIQKVISLNPFKMRISWFNTKSCKEFGPMDWVGSGFAKSCGDFRSGKYELTDALNAFSHKVDFTKGARGLLHIYPKKGQVWALYRNWSPEWDRDTPDEVKHKYDMVEVLDEYTEDKQNLTVTLLVKAEGFKAVFRRSTEEKDVRKIQKEEMFRFSHQVPHYVLTGKEADNVPEGCLELDPAATPCELLLEEKESSQMDIDKCEKSSAREEEMGMKID